MKIVSRTTLPGSPEEIWPLLCSSKMELGTACLFQLGLPRPVECRLPGGSGGVGEERQCISDRGVIRQRITGWEAPRRLKFEMEETTLYFRPCVASIREEFLLTPRNDKQTEVRRTTEIEVTGFASRLKGLGIWVGMKKIHCYVFRNWRRIVSKELLAASASR